MLNCNELSLTYIDLLSRLLCFWLVNYKSLINSDLCNALY